MRFPHATAVAAAILALPSLTRAQDLDVHVRAEPQAKVFLAFSTARGPGLALAGVKGMLRLDLVRLMLLPGAAPNSFGVSVTHIPGAGALPADLLHCQALILGANGATLTRVFLPLVDQKVDSVESTLVLGPAGPQGQYLFGMTRTQILDAARAYAPGAIDEARVLAELSRPFRRSHDPRLADAMGVESSLRALHANLDMMLRRVPMAQMAPTLVRLQGTMRETYFAGKYPNGVSEDDELWDFSVEQGSSSFASCGTDIKVTSGDYRMTLESDVYAHSAGYAWGSGYAIAYHRDWLGIWWKDKADSIKVTVKVSTDLQTNTFTDTDYNVKYVLEGGAAWYTTASSDYVETSATVKWGAKTLSANGCDT